MTKRKRDSEGRFASEGITGPVRDHPWASAAIAAGAAAASAFLWSRRDRIGEKIDNWSENLRNQKSGAGSKAAGKSSVSLGTETGQSELAGAGTSATSSSNRATGGRSGKAQSGQTMSPSRDTTPSPTM